MTLMPTCTDLRSRLESNQCDNIHGLLSEHLIQCRDRLYRLQVTNSPSYKSAFGESQVHWLGALLNAWPVGKKANQIPVFLKKHSSFDVSSTLRLLGLNRIEVSRVVTSLEILTLASKPQASSAELEELAIRCGELSRCQLCEYAQITTNYATEEMQFRGCIENPKIADPIFGECSLFIRRGSISD